MEMEEMKERGKRERIPLKIGSTQSEEEEEE